MSNYGPPNGQYPGQPSDPWQHQDDPYGQPGDAQYPTAPYGSPDPWSTPGTAGPVSPGQQPHGQPGGYEPGYGGQPGYGQPEYPPQPDPYGAAAPPTAWGPPAPPPKKRGPGVFIGMVAVLVVLLCGGGLVALYLIGKNGAKPASQQSQAPLAQSTGQASPMPTAANSPTVDMLDPVTGIKVGQCVVNNGSNNQADLQIVPCKKNTFKVLARFNNTLEPKRCSSVAGYTHYFTYETTPKTDDFLLCLKQQ